jgi:hypothetical protein
LHLGAFGIRIQAEDKAMDSMITLNLRSDSQKAAADNLPNAQVKEPEPPVSSSKRLNRILKKAAHKASGEYGAGKSGIFSK